MNKEQVIMWGASMMTVDSGATGYKSTATGHMSGNVPYPEPQMDWDAIRRARAAGRDTLPWSLPSATHLKPVPDTGCMTARKKGHNGLCVECPLPDCLARGTE